MRCDDSISETVRISPAVANQRVRVSSVTPATRGTDGGNQSPEEAAVDRRGVARETEEKDSAPEEEGGQGDLGQRQTIEECPGERFSDQKIAEGRGAGQISEIEEERLRRDHPGAQQSGPGEQAAFD